MSGPKGTGGSTETDEFSEKLQTAFDPPLFMENHIAFFSPKNLFKALYKGPKSAM